MTREHDEVSVRRPVRLIVVAWAVRELDGELSADLLPPQRAGHAVDERLAVRRPRDARRPARQLRQVHLAVVVGVRQVDLLQYRLALRAGGSGYRQRQHADRRHRRTSEEAHAFCDSTSVASRIVIASSTWAFVIISGGMKRIVLTPH